MTVDVSSRELWTLSSHMSDVIGAFRHHLKDRDVGSAMRVRWDATIFRTSRDPVDTVSLRILDCLKAFETLFIKCRHLDPELLNVFIKYCVEHGKNMKLVSLDNALPDAPVISDRYVVCEIQLDEFSFKYWNNDFLPIMGVERVR